MTQWLLIGDVHAVPTELDDCRRLVGLVECTLADYPEARPVLLGDQHHTHGVVQLATVSFWRDLAQVDKSVYLDQTGEKYAPLFASNNIGMMIKPATGTDDIYVAAVNGTGTPTFTASGLKLRMGFI